MRFFLRISSSLLIILLFGLITIVNTQTPVDSTLLSTPNSCIYNHLFNLQTKTYNLEEAAISFQLAKNGKQAKKNAIHLKQILDAKGLYVYMSTIPDIANYSDSLTGQAIYIPFPKKMPEVYVQKVDGKWFYSEETNRMIPSLLNKTFPFGSYQLIQHLGTTQKSSIMGLAVWQFIAIFIFLILCFILYKLLSIIVHFIYRKILRDRLKTITSFDKDNKLSNPISIIIVFYFASIFLPILQLDVKWTENINIGINIIISIVLGLILIRLVDVLLFYLTRITEKTESKLDEQLMPMLRRFLKIVVFLITTMYVLNMLNVNITALIAGVSIGGLALALAAQDTVKNLIGSMMIFLDAPFQIGDYIIVNGMDGTIIEVGFRSTKIQTIDSSIITIPNGNLSSTALTNKGARKYRLFNTTLTLSYGTTTSQIKAFLKGLKSIIHGHLNTDNEGFYVHLVNLNSSSIDILFRVKLITDEYDQELKIKEELLFSIIGLAEELSIDFAFPSQSIYIEKK